MSRRRGSGRPGRGGASAEARAPSRCAVVAVAPGTASPRCSARSAPPWWRAGPAATLPWGSSSPPRPKPPRASASFRNHPNVVPAAEGAAAEMEGVTVIPTGSVVEGSAAARPATPRRKPPATRSGPGRHSRGSYPLRSPWPHGRPRRQGVSPGRPAPGDRRRRGPSGGRGSVDVLLEVIRPLVGEEHEVVTALTGNGVGDVDRGGASWPRPSPGWRSRSTTAASRTTRCWPAWSEPRYFARRTPLRPGGLGQEVREAAGVTGGRVGRGPLHHYPATTSTGRRRRRSGRSAWGSGRWSSPGWAR